jgi:hypothetical protein
MSVAFFPSDSSPDFVISEGLTDTNGLFVAAGKTIHSMSFTVTKEGHYTTEGQYWFLRKGTNCVQGGKWHPWNPTNAVLLKEHRNPVAMYAKKVDSIFPIRDAPVGFDLEVGDWIAPYGKGSKGDIFFTYHSEIKDYWTGKKELTIACINKMEGFCRTRKDIGNGLNSAYEAPNADYQPILNLIQDATQNKVLQSVEIPRSEYLAFRVRIVLDDKYNIVSARYGKIYGPLEYGAGKDLNRLVFTYYLNPTPNDRNLEFDPARNLFGPDVKPRVYQP